MTTPPQPFLMDRGRGGNDRDDDDDFASESFSNAIGKSLEMSYLLKGRSPWVNASSLTNQMNQTSMDINRTRSISFASGVLQSPNNSLRDVRVGDREGDLSEPFLKPKRDDEGAAGGDSSEKAYDPVTGEELPELVSSWKADDVPPLSTFWQSVFNSTNLLMGVGLLSLPYACRLSGWLGVAVMIFFAWMTNYTAKLLGKIMDFQPSIKLRDGPGAYTMFGFADMGMVAFGDAGRTFMWIVFVFETFGYACIYVIIEGQNLRSQLIRFDAFKTWQNYDYMMVASCVFLPTMWLPNLSLLSYFSAFGVVSSVCLLLGVVIDGLLQVPPNTNCIAPACTGSLFHPSPTTMYKFNDLPAVIGIVMVGFAGHAVFPTIRNDMCDKKHYNLMVDVTYVTVLAAYLGMAVAGYLMFGDTSEEEITLNLGKNVISQITVWIVITNPISKYALDMSPISFGLESFFQVLLKIPRSSWWFTAVSLSLRTTLVFISLAVVLAIPHFAVLLGLMGSLCSFTISVSFPCACYLKIFWNEVSTFEKVVNIIFVILGVAGAIMGTYSALTSGSEGLGGSFHK